MSGNNGNSTPTYDVPKPRAEWITKRKEHAAQTGDSNMSQMHFARQGLITEEMAFIAHNEKIAAELVRSEVAKGTMIIPANINHPELEPMAIGVETRCKINANIGNSSVTSNVEEELKKLHTSVHFGADTVMDLSTGGDIHSIREVILRHSPVPIGTVPIYEAVARVKRLEDLTCRPDAGSDRRAGAAGCGLHDDPRGITDPVRPDGSEAHHGHREPWRIDHGTVDDPSPQAELSV